MIIRHPALLMGLFFALLVGVMVAPYFVMGYLP